MFQFMNPYMIQKKLRNDKYRNDRYRRDSKI